MTRETETAVMQPRMPGATKGQGRVLPQSLGEEAACLHLGFGCLAPRTESQKILLFQATKLWSFVTAALGNQYSQHDIFFFVCKNEAT